MFKRIIVPLDGSQLGEAALPYVEEIATATKAEVILFQAVPPPHHDVMLAEHYVAQLSHMEDEYIANASNTAKGYLDNVKERLSKRGIVAHSVIEVGQPAERIINYIERNNIDLIAMSTHGRSGISHWIFGSVAEKVLHVAGIPLLLIRAAKG